MADSNENFWEQSQQSASQNGNENGGLNEMNQQGLDGLQNAVGNEAAMVDETDLDELKQRVKGMDEEAARLIQLQNEMEQQMKSTASPTPGFGGSFGSAPMSAEEKMEADARSIYVGNVDYSATAQELEAHFHGCGSINRVTILCDKFSGHPKGFAYIEFGDKDSVQTAQALDDSLFKGRQIKVVSKRTNRPGISSTDRLPGRGRGGMAGIPYGFVPIRGRGSIARGGGFNPYMRSFRGRVVK
jgi:polyadenylate-binding protein 2